MSYTVGQELLDGQVVVVEVNDTAPIPYIVVEFPNIGSASGPVRLAVNPNITIAALQALLDALLDAQP